MAAASASSLAASAGGLLASSVFFFTTTESPDSTSSFPRSLLTLSSPSSTTMRVESRPTLGQEVRRFRVDGSVRGLERHFHGEGLHQDVLP
jgi:hypothetical protein